MKKASRGREQGFTAFPLKAYSLQYTEDFRSEDRREEEADEEQRETLLRELLQRPIESYQSPILGNLFSAITRGPKSLVMTKEPRRKKEEFISHPGKVSSRCKPLGGGKQAREEEIRRF